MEEVRREGEYSYDNFMRLLTGVLRETIIRFIHGVKDMSKECQISMRG